MNKNNYESNKATETMPKKTIYDGINISKTAIDVTITVISSLLFAILLLAILNS